MRSSGIKLFLSGDVMVGRGIDQILPHPSDPRLHETYVSDARRYVELAERHCRDSIAPAGNLSFIWDFAGTELRRVSPELRIVNLETSITTSDRYWPGKAVHYRIHPANAPCLSAFGIDCCVLANNHLMDWGRSGLLETLRVLDSLGISHAGAGATQDEASRPAVLKLAHGGNRLLVFSLATPDCGVPEEWAASRDQPGINRLAEVSGDSADAVGEWIASSRLPGDRVVLSIHWGSNWSHHIPEEQITFAHRLIDLGAADIVHGHSSHHVKAVEVYRERLVLYGCGDLVTDYEGIEGAEEFRGDLGLMYFPELDPESGALLDLQMSATQMHRLRVAKASRRDSELLAHVLSRDGARFGVSARVKHDDRLTLVWNAV